MCACGREMQNHRNTPRPSPLPSPHAHLPRRPFFTGEFIDKGEKIEVNKLYVGGGGGGK